MSGTTPSPEQVLLVDQHNDVLVATLNRAQKGNSLNTELIDALGTLAADLSREDGPYPDIKAVIITGAGRSAFSAGADINTLIGLGEAAAETLARALVRAMLAAETAGKTPSYKDKFPGAVAK